MVVTDLRNLTISDFQSGQKENFTLRTQVLDLRLKRVARLATVDARAAPFFEQRQTEHEAGDWRERSAHSRY